MVMRPVLAGTLMLVAMAVAGCATGEEWAAWKSHPAHFASAEHMVFSVRNREGGTPTVARTDIALAGSEGWWGKTVTVGQEQILER
jgi:hypothetical protein